LRFPFPYHDGWAGYCVHQRTAETIEEAVDLWEEKRDEIRYKAVTLGLKEKMRKMGGIEIVVSAHGWEFTRKPL